MKIISKDIKDRLADASRPKLQAVFYYFFTDGGNKYPDREVKEVIASFRADQALWTSASGGCILQPTFITN